MRLPWRFPFNPCGGEPAPRLPKGLERRDISAGYPCRVRRPHGIAGLPARRRGAWLRRLALTLDPYSGDCCRLSISGHDVRLGRHDRPISIFP